MPYTLKPNKLFVKDPNGSGYLPQNVVTDRTTDDMVAEINSAGANQITAIGNKGTQTLETIPDDYTALSNQVDNLKSAFNSLVKLNIAFDKSGYINKNTGALVPHNGYRSTDFISVIGIASKIRYDVKSFSSIAIIAFYDAEKVFISSIASSSSSLIIEKGDASIPDMAVYARISCDSAYIPSIYSSGIEFGEAHGKIIGIDNVVFSEHDDGTNLIDKDKLIKGYYIDGTNGSPHVGSGMYVTTYIPLEEGVQYYYNGNYLYRGYCAFYNSEYEYISGIDTASASVFLPSPFTIPAGAKYGRFTISSQNRIANAWLCRFNKMSVKPDDYKSKIKTHFTANNPTEYTGEEITVFKKILCIGDSLTDGFFNESGGARLVMRDRSYPTKLQALTGVECINLGYSGYTSVQWYEAYHEADLSGYDACIIQLGVNDVLKGTSTADTTTAFGNIITKLKNENNHIKIFVATIPPANGYMLTSMRTMSETIRSIVENLNDSQVYLVDLWRYGNTDNTLAYDSGHLSALGYLRLAQDYKAYISSIIHDNPMDFREVQFIGTNYTLTQEEYTRAIPY